VAKFKITVHVENENILEFPKTLWFDCDLVIPLGENVIRQYNSSECILARKVYLFGYNGIRYGCFDFKTMQDFIDFRNDNCIGSDDDCCKLLYNGCYITYNNKIVTYNK